MDLGIAFFVLATLVAINCSFYIFLSKIIRYKESTTTAAALKPEPVSIIVCAKNEEHNLKTLVPLLLQQDYPTFEIILINDTSTDLTKDVIEEFMLLDNRVKMVDVIPNENFWGNKKYALTLGIKKAVHAKHVFIDADCKPASEQWLQLMASKMSGNKTIVLGYGGYAGIKGSFLNAIIRYETLLTAFQYFGYAVHGKPYMGVGRNLAYTNEQFYDVNGFMNHIKIIGGDDDLFVNQAATAVNTAVQINPLSFTLSQPKTSWSAWITQKRRHINTARFYKPSQQFFLGLFYVSQLGFFIAAATAFVLETHWELTLALVVSRYALVWVVMGFAASRFRESELKKIIPVLEIIVIYTQCYLFFTTPRKTKKW